MPLSGENERVGTIETDKQVELYEATNGMEGGTLRCNPVIILTFQEAKSIKIQKTTLMKIEHDGTYAVSLPTPALLPTASGIATSSPIRLSSCRMARSSNEMRVHGLRRGKVRMVEAR